MIEFIDGVLGPLLWFLADWSLRWAVVIGVLAAWLALVRPHRSATRYLLSMLTLIAGVLLPLVPRWGPGLAMESAKVTQPEIIPAAAESGLAKSGGPDPAVRPKQKQPAIASAANESSPVRPSSGTIQRKSDNWGPRRITILSIVVLWILVVGFLALRWLVGWLLLARMRRTALPVQDASFRVFEASRAQLALHRQAHVACHPAVRSPVTLGLYRPIILVPPSWSELPELTQRGSLLHELAHLKRYDDWLALGLELVRIVFCFHPFVQWLIGRIEYERELLCDEAAVAHGIDPRAYAGVLLEFSQTGRLRPMFLCQSYPLGFGHRRTVKARINRLLEANMTRWMSPLPAHRAIAVAAVSLALALGLGSFRLRAIEREPEAPSLKSADQAAAQRPIESTPRAAPAAEQGSRPSVNVSYHIEPYHVLKIWAAGADPNNPIVGNYLVEPDGRVDLGPAYGKFAVAGFSLEDAEAAITTFLKKLGIKRPDVSVSLAGWVTRWVNDPAMKAPYHIKPLQLLKIKVYGADANYPLDSERLDPGHATGFWTGPHINVAGVHIPVAPGFVP